jgi:TRAP-type mannitol/chloroaromatic compound transport system permease small subunit
MRWAVKGLIPVGFGLLALQTLGGLIKLVFVERERRAADTQHV